MRVLIAGAAGQIGRQMVEELSLRHELCLIDRSRLSGQASIVADLAKPRSWIPWRSWLGDGHPAGTEAFQGAHVVLHLAVDQRPGLSRQQLLQNNIEMTVNVIGAAIRHQVSRVVFASSNWAIKALERELAPSCYMPDGPKIDSDAPPRPVTPYGIGKAFGEISGRAAVNEGRLVSFVAVRIGSYLPVPPEDEERRRRWIGPQDIRSLLRRCVEAEFDGFHVVYGVSAQPTAPYDLSHTRRLLCWEPRQLP